MNYCSSCGKPVIKRIPEGDDRERFVCDHCETIHYQNPCIIAGCVPVHENKVLLCKRAIEPRYGLWTLPAGFMENGETSLEAAIRETWEEAVATVAVRDIYTLFNLPHINQVYMFFLADLSEPEFSAGQESLEVALFEEHEIPWQELAFPVVARTLEHYFADLKAGHFPVRMQDIAPRR